MVRALRVLYSCLMGATPVSVVQDVGFAEVWVSDTASPFQNHVMRALEKVLELERRFAVSNSPWSNGTSGKMM